MRIILCANLSNMVPPTDIKIAYNTDVRGNISHNASGDAIRHNELDKTNTFPQIFFSIYSLLVTIAECVWGQIESLKKKSQTPRHCWVFNAVARQRYFTSNLTCPFYVRLWNKMQNKVSLTEDRKPSCCRCQDMITYDWLAESSTTQETSLHACFCFSGHVYEFL